MKKPYEYLEHTADMGMVVSGKSLSELLTHAAQGLFEAIAVVGTIDEIVSVEIHLTAESVEDYLWDGSMNLSFGMRRRRCFSNAQKSGSVVKRRCRRRFMANPQILINTRFIPRLRVLRIISCRLCKRVMGVGLLRLFLICNWLSVISCQICDLQRLCVGFGRCCLICGWVRTWAILHEFQNWC